VPFHTIRWYLQRFELFKLHIPTNGGIEAQIYGNILVFVPLGFLFPLVFGKASKPSQVIPAAAFFSVCIEITQWIFRVGEFDVDDVLLNTCGGAGGFILFAVYNRYARMRAEWDRKQ